MKIYTPQFERPPGVPAPASPPKSTHDWDALLKGNNDSDKLQKMGLRKWNDPNDKDDDWPHPGKQLWLLPGEWYCHIPDGFPIVLINGRTERFEAKGPNKTDDDIRFGCLAYGVLR